MQIITKTFMQQIKKIYFHCTATCRLNCLIGSRYRVAPMCYNIFFTMAYGASSALRVTGE